MTEQLIFDCDGVLVDSEIIAAQVMVDSLNEYGIPITIAYYLQNCTGKTFSGLKNSLSEQFGIPLPTYFVQEVTQKMENANSKKLRSIDGIEDLLNDLATIPKAVVSNSDLDQIEASLIKTNIIHHFEKHRFSSEQVEKPKPSPQVYLYAAYQLNVTPENCLVVEDSISGATSALEAGMKVIGFLAGSHIIDNHKDRLEEVGVQIITHTAIELKEIIKNHF